MRARDVRAIGFCVLSTVVLAVGSYLLLHKLLVTAALTAGWDAWLLTRPRMLRVYRRLRGDADWSGYFDNDGTRLTVRPSPGTAASPPRPAERP